MGTEVFRFVVTFVLILVILRMWRWLEDRTIRIRLQYRRWRLLQKIGERQKVNGFTPCGSCNHLSRTIKGSCDICGAPKSIPRFYGRRLGE